MGRRNAAERQDGEGAPMSKKVKRSEEETGIERRMTRAALAALSSSSEGKAEAPTSSQQTPGKVADDQDPCTSAATSNLSEKRARLRRKRMRGKPSAAVVDKNAEAVTRIKRQVKYYVNNINMEQNMIDAYSNEGWKGNNREKVRPVKELQKAKTKILQYKLKIREAMQELDTMCCEGSILESAFDDDGQLDYQEIFCCKCHSHDTDADNDIILCDGKCTRGFHQKCLVPPLATEQIPPGDEGWLCPVCDCKSDCVSHVNDHLETEFEVDTAWEAFFPEAVSDANNAAAQDLPSDESDDDDYDPNKKKPDEEEAPMAEGDGQADGEKQQQRDEDDEDDGEDDEDDKDENGEEGVDGDSDSDDVSTDLEGEEPLSGGEDEEVNKVDKEVEAKEDAEADNGKADEEAKQDEEQDEERSRLRGKRKRKEVDYKKLHDEMFGWGEYWEDEAAQSADEDYGTEKKARKRTEVASKSKKPKNVSKRVEANNNNKVPKKAASNEPRNKVTERASNREPNKVTERASSREPNKVSRKGTSHERSKASSHKHTDAIAADPRRLPSEAVKKLRRAFEENQLPTKSFKEKLSKELGLPYKKVDTWFKNFRTQALKSGLSQPIRPCPWKLKQAQEDAETNKLLTLLEKVQFKLHDMRKTMEAVKAPQVLKLPTAVNGFENSVIDVNRRKRVIYKPVAAEVVEKTPANNRKTTN